MKLLSKNRCLLLGILAVFLTFAALTVLYAPSTWAGESDTIILQ